MEKPFLRKADIPYVSGIYFLKVNIHICVCISVYNLYLCTSVYVFVSHICFSLVGHENKLMDLEDGSSRMVSGGL